MRWPTHSYRSQSSWHTPNHPTKIRSAPAATDSCHPGPSFRSEGVQYASNDYKARLKKRKIRGSMGRKGNCYDNATMESFWKTLKYEQVYREEYATLEQARASIGRFIERIYNRKRLHSALGYRPPAEFEAIQE